MMTMMETQNSFAAILRACAEQSMKIAQIEEDERVIEACKGMNRRQISADVYAMYRMGFLTRRANTKGAYYHTTAIGQEALALLEGNNVQV